MNAAVLVLALAGFAHAGDIVSLLPVVQSSGTRTVGITSDGREQTSAAQAGTYTVTPGTGTWTINNSSPTVYQGGAPWSMSQSGSYTVTPGTGIWTISNSSPTVYQGGLWNVTISSPQVSASGAVKTRDDSSSTVGASTNSIATTIAGYGENGLTAVPTVSSMNSVGMIQVIETGSLEYLAAKGKAFAVSYEATISGSAETDLLLFVNLSTNTRTVTLQTCGVTIEDNNASAAFRVYSAPVVTSSGTFRSPVSRSVGGTSFTSQMQGFGTPTISSRGSLQNITGSGKGSVSYINVAGGLIVNPGGKLLVTTQPSGSGFISSVTLVWTEQ